MMQVFRVEYLSTIANASILQLIAVHCRMKASIKEANQLSFGLRHPSLPAIFFKSSLHRALVRPEQCLPHHGLHSRTHRL